MKLRRLHLVEKLRLQFAAALSLGLVYFLLYRAFGSWDPRSPVMFLALGRYGDLAMFVVFLTALAVLCGAVTVGTRPAGALVATLVGAMAVSFRSPQARAVLWTRSGELGGLFAAMIAEVVVLALAVALAAVVIKLVSQVMGFLNPGWVWRDPLADLGEADRRRMAQVAVEAGDKMHYGGLVLRSVHWLGAIGSRKVGKRLEVRQALRICLYSLALSVAIAMVVLLLLLRSPDRGQIVFAVAGSMFVGTLVANQAFPAPSALPAAVLPVICAVALYAVAAFKCAGGVDAWMNVPLYGRVLPVDWVIAGGAGAVFGYWVSARLHESRHEHALESKDEGA